MEVEQSEKEKIFSQLLSQVITESRDDFSLDEVKDFFASEINSARSLDKAASLREVFHLLQKRDLLSWRKVTPLQRFGELLSNDKIKDIVRCYKKTCLDEDDENCPFCGLCIEQVSPPVPLSEHHGNQDSVLNTQNNSVDSLNAAFENISLSLGPKWGVVARELGLREIQIDKCKATHPENYVAQARLAFKMWRQNEKENASIERLDRALEARLSKRMGFGVHLRNPVVGV